MHLLDVNVLIALCDTEHGHHAVAQDWLVNRSQGGWATCPLTENGLLRILGNSRYPGNGAGNPELAAVALRGMVATVPGHRFLLDDISLRTAFTDLTGISSTQLTDAYLLALAVHHSVKFLTFDRRIDPARVPGGAAAMERLI